MPLALDDENYNIDFEHRAEFVIGDVLPLHPLHEWSTWGSRCEMM